MKAILKLLPSCLFFFAFMPVCRAQQSPYLLPGEWDVYAGLDASQGLHKDAAHLFRGTGFSTELGARYYFGRFGLSVATGFVTGAADNDAVNDFIRERKYPRDQLRISKSEAVNGYLMIGPSFRFGGRFFVNADLRGGLMVNNPGTLDMTSTESGRSMYRFGGTDRSLFPGFSGDVSLNYAVSRSVRIFVHTAYLQSKASVSLIDVGGGFKEAARVNRSMKVMSAGIGLIKIFHPGGSAGGNHRGVIQNPLYEPKGSSGENPLYDGGKRESVTRNPLYEPKGSAEENPLYDGGKREGVIQNPLYEEKGQAGENPLYDGGNRITQNGSGPRRAVIRLEPDGAIIGKLQAQDYNSTRSNKGYGLIVIDGNGILSGRMEAQDYNSTRSNKGYGIIRVDGTGAVKGVLSWQDYNSTRSNKILIRTGPGGSVTGRLVDADDKTQAPGESLLTIGPGGVLTGQLNARDYNSTRSNKGYGLIRVGEDGRVTGKLEAQDYNSTRSNKGYGLVRVGEDGTVTGQLSREGYDAPAPGVSSGMMLIGQNGSVTGMVEAQDYNSTRSNKGR
jgi:hypothetical protein